MIAATHAESPPRELAYAYPAMEGARTFLDSFEARRHTVRSAVMQADQWAADPRSKDQSWSVVAQGEGRVSLIQIISHPHEN